MTGVDEDELSRLFTSALAGDGRAYEAFLSKVAIRIRAVVRRRLNAGAVDAEDIVQETLLAIHLKRHTWRTDSAVLPWASAIARYKLIDAFRRRGRRVELDIDLFADTLSEPVPETVRAVEIDRALERLGPVQRAVVRSISLDGKSIAETARAMGMTEVAVRVSLHRGLAAISRHFGRP